MKKVMLAIVFAVSMSGAGIAQNPAFGNVAVVEYCHELSDTLINFVGAAKFADNGDFETAKKQYSDSMGVFTHFRITQMIAGPELGEFLEHAEDQMADLSVMSLDCIRAANGSSDADCDFEALAARFQWFERGLFKACETDYRTKG